MLKLFYYGPILIWMVCIFIASTRAGSAGTSSRLIVPVLNFLEPGRGDELTPESLDKVNYVLRKAAHISEYFLLTVIFIRAYQFGRQDLRLGALLGGGGCALLYAASDEFHQRFVPGRTSSPHDVFIDSLGILLSMALTTGFFLIKRLERHLRERETGSFS
jgi:VanZ family protein